MDSQRAWIQAVVSLPDHELNVFHVLHRSAVSNASVGSIFTTASAAWVVGNDGVETLIHVENRARWLTLHVSDTTFTEFGISLWIV